MLVHGGGKLATRLSARLGIKTKMIDGRRITDRDTLDVVTMVYAGLTNKQIVASLVASGSPAIGLCGADANVVPAKRRSPEPIDYGYVGDIEPEKICTQVLCGLMEQGATPVLCAITHDGHGQLLNSNADSVASAIAIALSAVAPTELIYCFEKNGVLRNVDDYSSVIPHINAESFETLKQEGAIHSGMLPKIAGALRAVEAGVARVLIKRHDCLLSESGTVISKNS